MKKGMWYLLLLFLLFSRNLLAQPIQLHPENKHYFLYKSKPTILVASTEHYGSVVNPDFNYELYLKTLAKIGLNHTRIFLGDYAEKPGDFCIIQNTLVPNPGKFLGPWQRSTVPGFSLGGNKFDLSKWNPAYFEQLHGFMKLAEELNITVEAVFFFIGMSLADMPLNPANNINKTSSFTTQQYMSLNNGNVLEHQKKYVLKLVNELNRYDNLILNIANEPWFFNQEHTGFSSPTTDATKQWIRVVSQWIVNQEKKLPKKHLISVDYTNEGRKISKVEHDKYWTNISVFNHHYDKNAESVKLNYGINKVLSFNETGLMPPSSPQYRIQGYRYLLSGGALYDNLDFTFQVGHEDGRGGTDFSCLGYQGCSDQSVKFQMKALLDFMNSFDFVHTKPNKNVIAVTFGDRDVAVLENPGKEYAIYVNGGSNTGMLLQLVAGNYKALWISPTDNSLIKAEEITTKANGEIRVTEPPYKEDIALLLKKIN
ncbi:MAG: hypothetical protein U0Y10_14560 [Spirosomataceae bacterium]